LREKHDLTKNGAAYLNQLTPATQGVIISAK
jgi:hypothetical protein